MIRLSSLSICCLLFFCTLSRSFTPPNMGGAVGCVVTSDRLFSHGNFIRQLNKEEMGQLAAYNKDLAAFKKKIDDAFENAEKVEATNSTVPPMPTRPAMPSFCTGKDTTLYIFGGCTVQNNRVYVGKTFARELDEREKAKLASFVTTMGTQSKDSSKALTDLQLCTEF